MSAAALGRGPTQEEQAWSPGPAPLPLFTFGPFADYQTLRIGGLVFAVVLFSVGILLILSKCVPFLHGCWTDGGGMQARPFFDCRKGEGTVLPLHGISRINTGLGM